MDLLQVNHVITAVNEMLEGLVDQDVIGGADRANLLPVLVKHVIQNDSLDIGGD